MNAMLRNLKFHVEPWYNRNFVKIQVYIWSFP